MSSEYDPEGEEHDGLGLKLAFWMAFIGLAALAIVGVCFLAERMY